MSETIRREGKSKLHGRPLDDNGKIELTVERPRPEASEAKEEIIEIDEDGNVHDFREVFRLREQLINTQRENLRLAKADIFALTQSLDNLRQQLAEADAERARLKEALGEIVEKIRDGERLFTSVLECELAHDERGHAYLKVPARSIADLANLINGYLGAGVADELAALLAAHPEQKA